MSEQRGQEPGEDAPRGEHETTLVAGAPGPSGTGTRTEAGADPEATGEPHAPQGSDDTKGTGA